MKRLRILVVEDDGMVAYLLGQILEDMGYEVCGTESSQSGAIAAANRLRPGLMIVDENLGRESGVEVMRAVLEEGPMAHIYVGGDVSRLRKSMPSAIVIEKPYFEADLQQAIWNAMARPPATMVEQFGPTAAPTPDTGS